MAKIISLKTREQKRAEEIVARLKKLFPRATIALNYHNNWELLVAVILSAQCTDKKVNEVTEKLFKKYRTLDDYVHASLREFERDIYSTGFYHTKAKNILATAKILKTKYNGTVPRTMEEILTLPGVARKTANIVLGRAYGVTEGIAVDTHVKRLSGLLGLTTSKNPIIIERDLIKLIPRKDWSKISYLLMEYGREYCKALPHKHENCPLRDFYNLSEHK